MEKRKAEMERLRKMIREQEMRLGIKRQKTEAPPAAAAAAAAAASVDPHPVTTENPPPAGKGDTSVGGPQASESHPTALVDGYGATTVPPSACDGEGGDFDVVLEDAGDEEIEADHPRSQGEGGRYNDEEDRWNGGSAAS